MRAPAETGNTIFPLQQADAVKALPTPSRLAELKLLIALRAEVIA
jgi:hypothetical protein